MIRNISTRSTRNTLALALALSAAGLCAAQTTTTASAAPPAAKTPPTPPSVFVNPRSGPEDPRVGLKGGLYDASTAILGMQLVMTTPKPAGFAPDLDSIKAVDATPPPPPVDPDAPRPPGAAVPRPQRPSRQLRRNELRPRLQRKVPVQRQLQRRQYL